MAALSVVDYAEASHLKPRGLGEGSHPQLRNVPKFGSDAISMNWLMLL
jgi:hypothetical protein